jgi:hypothetical protein
MTRTCERLVRRSAGGTDAGSGFGTFPESINDAGAITGHYIDAQGLNHGCGFHEQAVPSSVSLANTRDSPLGVRSGRRAPKNTSPGCRRRA